MACFLVPTVFGILAHAQKKKIPQHWHLNWLNIMIFGGALGLLIEHIAHGEIVPFPPFLTAMANPADTMTMLHEMAIVGIPMTLALVGAWALLVVVFNRWYALSTNLKSQHVPE